MKHSLLLILAASIAASTTQAFALDEADAKDFQDILEFAYPLVVDVDGYRTFEEVCTSGVKDSLMHLPEATRTDLISQCVKASEKKWEARKTGMKTPVHKPHDHQHHHEGCQQHGQK